MHVHMHVPGWTLLHTYRLGLMCKFLVFWPDPIHQPTHPPIHTPPMGGKFFRDFKSSNRIEISWLVQVLLNFYWFWGSTPWGVADGWMKVGVGLGVWGVSHAHMNAHACMHMHVKHDKHAKHGYLHVGGHLQFLYMYTCVCVHVHVYTCMCMHVGTPPMPPDTPRQPPTHLPSPQSHRDPKTPKFNKSWTNQDNLILFEDSLPLNTPELIYTIVGHPGDPQPTCPTPQSWGNPNQKNYNNSWTNWDNSILFEDLWPLKPPAHI